MSRRSYSTKKMDPLSSISAAVRRVYRYYSPGVTSDLWTDLQILGEIFWTASGQKWNSIQVFFFPDKEELKKLFGANNEYKVELNCGYGVYSQTDSQAYWRATTITCTKLGLSQTENYTSILNKCKNAVNSSPRRKTSSKEPVLIDISGAYNEGANCLVIFNDENRSSQYYYCGGSAPLSIFREEEQIPFNLIQY